MLLAQVPNTVIVDRSKAEAEVAVTYDGEPQFKPIKETSLSYASNTQDKVIKVGDLYYLCFQGVWFMSTAPTGPWKTAESVPQEIYTIPSSSPVYNVTYVTQTTTPSGETEASSTAGYLGMFIIGAAVGATFGLRKRLLLPAVLLLRTVPISDLSPLPHHLWSRRLLQPAQRGVRCSSRCIWALRWSRGSRLVQPIDRSSGTSRRGMWCVRLCRSRPRVQPVHGGLRCNAAGIECLQPMGKLGCYQG